MLNGSDIFNYDQSNLKRKNLESEVLESDQIPIWEKTNLTIKEAAVYSNIGINRIDKLLRTPNCPFVLYVGTKKLVKRRAFEEYLNNALQI